MTYSFKSFQDLDKFMYVIRDELIALKCQDDLDRFVKTLRRGISSSTTEVLGEARNALRQLKHEHAYQRLTAETQAGIIAALEAIDEAFRKAEKS